MLEPPLRVRSNPAPSLRSRGLHPILLGGLLAALLLLPTATFLLGGTPATTRGSPVGAAPSATVGIASPVPSYSYPTPIHHVFTVFLENNELSTVKSQGPYEMYLAQKYAFASQYYAVCHFSVANYLSVTSGKPWQCGTDNYYTYSTENIGDLAQAAGLSWDGFMESMPSACDTSSSGAYTVHHNPFVAYTDIVGNGSLCSAHDVSFATWNGDVANGTLPAYAFFAPNRTNDAHDTNVSYADHWLKGWLSPYLNDSWFNSTVWFIVYDEGGTNVGFNGMWGGHVYMTAVSPWVRMNSTFTNDSTHYNLLATTEWLLGLGGTGNNDSSSTYPAMKGLFNFSSSPPPTKYTVSGTVSTATTGAPIAGATVSVTGGPSAQTNAGGAYSLQLANGSYLASALASGYSGTTVAFQVAGGDVLVNFSLSPSSGTNATFPLTGTVASLASGQPIAGATLTIAGGSTTTTNGQGQYAFEVRNGSYALRVAAGGYQGQSATLTVAGAVLWHNFSLATFTYGVAGTVTSRAGGAPIPGATVRQGASVLATTDTSGRYALQLGNGTIALSFSATGYVAQNATVTVSGQPVTVDVALAPQSGGPTPFTLSLRYAPSGTPPVVAESLTFTAVVSGTTAALVYAWSFGDGTMSSAPAPVHEYSAAGNYTVSLTARASDGSSATANLSVAIASVGGNTPPTTSVPPGIGSYFTAFGWDLVGSPWGWLALGLLALLVLELGVLWRRRRGRSTFPPPARARPHRLGAVNSEGAPADARTRSPPS
jgi:Phosphoesterase family/PKD domain/Carboxypeptidase regulatory-like domain